MLRRYIVLVVQLLEKNGHQVQDLGHHQTQLLCLHQPRSARPRLQLRLQSFGRRFSLWRLLHHSLPPPNHMLCRQHPGALTLDLRVLTGHARGGLVAGFLHTPLARWPLSLMRGALLRSDWFGLT
jgi:hypothetical protein